MASSILLLYLVELKNVKMKTIKIKASEIYKHFSGLAAMQAKAVLSTQDSYTLTIESRNLTFEISAS